MVMTKTTSTKHDQGVLILILCNKLGLRNTLGLRNLSVQVPWLLFSSRGPTFGSNYTTTTENVTTSSHCIINQLSEISFPSHQSKKTKLLLLVGVLGKACQIDFLKIIFAQGRRNRIFDYEQFNCLYIYTDRQNLNTNVIYYTDGCC